MRGHRRHGERHSVINLVEDIMRQVYPVVVAFQGGVFFTVARGPVPRVVQRPAVAF